jgi:DNA repair protein RadA/Sms
MAKKILSTYVCSECAHESVQRAGKCLKCGAWNTFSQIYEQNSQNYIKEKCVVIPSTEIKNLSYNRIQTQVEEFDRVVGGGIVEGSLILLGGEPGIGKSTLLTSVLGEYSKFNEAYALYISGEETIEQVGQRIKRLNICNDYYLVGHETKWSAIENKMRELKPKLVLIDSIQTIFSTEVNGHPGSSSQVKEVTLALMNYSKEYKVSIIIIGHITKDGSIAGPKLLEHMVDTVMYFELEKNTSYRILRPIKNRFGATNEVGVFQMNEKGLTSVKNPLELFVESKNNKAYGSCLTKISHSTREILCEVQALILINNNGIQKKITQGFDQNRLTMILAIFEKYLNIRLFEYDVFINITGPVLKFDKILDLSVMAAIISSYRKKIIKRELILYGEVGLNGHIIQSSIKNLKMIKDLEVYLY